MNGRTTRCLGFVGAVLIFATTSSAQAQPRRRPAAPQQPQAPQSQQQQQGFNQNNPQQQQRVTANRPTGEGQQGDAMIAAWLGIDNQLEVATAKDEAAKTQNQQVRQFAEMLVKDHSDLLGQLGKFGGNMPMLAAHNSNANNGNEATQRTGAREPQPGGQAERGQAERGQTERGQAERGQAERGQGAQGGFNVLEVKREIASRCLATAQKELNSKQGNERDESFIGHQIANHEQMLDTLHVMRQYASAELQPVIDKGIEGTQHHLEQAKQLMHSIVKADPQLKGDQNQNRGAQNRDSENKRSDSDRNDQKNQ